MNYNRMSEWFLEFSEKLLAILINLIYLGLLTMPYFLFEILFKQSIVKIPLVFIPVVSLFAMAVKSLIYTIYMIVKKNGSYYKPYFFISLKDRFLKSFLYYLISITILYIGLSSSWILIHEVSSVFWLVFAFVSIVILTNLIYTSLQLALYEQENFKLIIKNSMILTLSLGVISIAMYIILVWMIYSFRMMPFKIVFIGIPVYSVLLFLIYLLMENRKRMLD
ncbi:MAG: hypothetical protein Q4E50_00255 [Tissierellia bacterium]|nr:hypothetical protein [Tissierellia bacterium]